MFLRKDYYELELMTTAYMKRIISSIICNKKYLVESLIAFHKKLRF